MKGLRNLFIKLRVNEYRKKKDIVVVKKKIGNGIANITKRLTKMMMG